LTRYSLEEEIAPYFRRAGLFLSIGRPTQFAQMIGTTRVYVEDKYWQSLVVDLLGIADLVVVRADVVVVGADVSSGLAWEIEQVFRRMPAERIILLFADKYGNPYTKEKYLKFLSTLPQETRNVLPSPLDDLSYVYFEPDGTSCAVVKEKTESISDATARLIRSVSKGVDQKSTTATNILAPDDDQDAIYKAAMGTYYVGASLVGLDAIRLLFW
jgi:hypothetical protein